GRRRLIPPDAFILGALAALAWRWRPLTATFATLALLTIAHRALRGSPPDLVLLAAWPGVQLAGAWAALGWRRRLVWALAGFLLYGVVVAAAGGFRGALAASRIVAVALVAVPLVQAWRAARASAGAWPAPKWIVGASLVLPLSSLADLGT